MQQYVHQFSLFMSGLTVVGQIIVIGLLVMLPMMKRSEWPKWFEEIAKRGVLFAWIVAMIATLGSLSYSQIFLLVPCIMCWFQRIFMYPLAGILGLALWRKKTDIIPYGIFLSAIGLCFAAYHYVLQLGANIYAPCSAVASEPSCTQRVALTFGYITIPLMALTAFAMIIVFLRLRMLYEKGVKTSSKRTK